MALNIVAMEIKSLIKTYFEELDWHQEPINLYAPVDYALQSGGKRIRPTLVLMAVELFGGDIQKALRPAAAMEVFHNFTLLHDDVMDNADVRRGRPTVHAKWDANTAILSGDAMIIKAYQFFDDVEPAKYKTVVKLFSQMALEICEGQQYDSDFEHSEAVGLNDYFEMIRLKTAVLLATSLKIGAVLADAPEAEADAIYDFGIAIGLAFQLRDDYLDCYGDERTFGKKIGGDILCGKRSFILVKALEMATAEVRKNLLEMIDKSTMPNEEKIRKVIDIYTQMDMPSVCNEAIELYYQKSMDALDRIDKTAEAKRPFVELAQKLMGRND